VDAPLIVVIPSAGYADFLKISAPAWREFLPPADLRVVTTPEDQESARVATAAGCRAVVTEAWRDDGARVNKAAALDVAFGFDRPTPGILPPRDGQWCLSVDADVIPFGLFPALVDWPEARVLFGCPRYGCRSQAELDAYRRGEILRDDLPLILPRVKGHDPDLSPPVEPEDAARRALGFFQLFRWRPGIRFGSYPTAGKYDIEFRKHFTRRSALKHIHVLHLGALDRRNWRGRILPTWA
jgi:hypothetical protein